MKARVESNLETKVAGEIARSNKNVWIKPPGGENIPARFLNDSYYFDIWVPCFKFDPNGEFLNSGDSWTPPEVLPETRLQYHDCIDGHVYAEGIEDPPTAVGGGAEEAEAEAVLEEQQVLTPLRNVPMI